MTLNAVVAGPAQEEPEAYFSWSSCEACNSSLGGNRYDIVYKEVLDGDIFEASVCVECYEKLCI